MKIAHFIFFLIVFNYSNILVSQEVFEKEYGSFEEFLNEQNNKISKIQNDISREEVMEIMGNSIIVKIPKTGKIKELNQLFKQPEFIDEKHQKAKNNFFVLWFFSTPKDQNGIISKNECTPVVIKENIVIGKGQQFYFTYMKKNMLPVFK
jgi:hypothetical protein